MIAMAWAGSRLGSNKARYVANVREIAPSAMTLFRVHIQPDKNPAKGDKVLYAYSYSPPVLGNALTS